MLRTYWRSWNHSFWFDKWKIYLIFIEIHLKNYSSPSHLFWIFLFTLSFYYLKQLCRRSVSILQMRKLKTTEPKRLAWGHPAPRWKTKSPKFKSKRHSSNKSNQRFKEILRHLKDTRAINLTQGKEFKWPSFDTWPQKIFLLGLTNGFYCDTEMVISNCQIWTGWDRKGSEMCSLERDRVKRKWGFLELWGRNHLGWWVCVTCSSICLQTVNTLRILLWLVFLSGLNLPAPLYLVWTTDLLSKHFLYK